jgi:ankyrin repeat protein
MKLRLPLLALVFCAAPSAAHRSTPPPGADPASALAHAIDANEPETIPAILRAGASVNGRGYYRSRTVLMTAAQAGDARTVHFLLDEGAEIDAAGELETGGLLGVKFVPGCTSLMVAAYAGKPAVVRLLLDRGASVSARGADGRTALARAAERHSMQVSRPVRGVAPDHPLYGASIASFDVVEGDRIVRMLLAAGAEVDTRDRGGFTPLWHAVTSGGLRSARLLLAAGADPNAASNVPHQNPALRITSPLHQAVRGGDARTARLLIQYGAKLDTRDNTGETPLSLAVARGDTTCLEVIQRARAVPEPVPEARDGLRLHQVLPRVRSRHARDFRANSALTCSASAVRSSFSRTRASISR